MDDNYFINVFALLLKYVRHFKKKIRMPPKIASRFGEIRDKIWQALLGVCLPGCRHLCTLKDRGCVSEE